MANGDPKTRAAYAKKKRQDAVDNLKSAGTKARVAAKNALNKADDVYIKADRAYKAAEAAGSTFRDIDYTTVSGKMKNRK